MGQDPEAPGAQALHHRVGDRLRLEHAVHPRHASALPTRGHRRAHGLGTQTCDAQAAVAVGDREPLGEGHGRVLRDGVGGRADLGEQTRRGCRLEQRAAAALEHAGHQHARRPHVGHHVHLPDALPVRVGHVDAARHGDARVRAEEIDRAVRALGRGHQRPQRVGIAHVRAVALAADGRGHAARAVGVHVGHHHRARPFGREALAQGTPDAAGAPGHDHVRVAQLHRDGPPLVRAGAYR